MSIRNSTHQNLSGWVSGVAAAALIGAAGSAHAATITWTGGTFTEASFASKLPAANHVVYAENYGGAAITVGGISFAQADRGTMADLSGEWKGPSGLTKSTYHFGYAGAMVDAGGKVGDIADNNLEALLGTALREPTWWTHYAAVQLTTLTVGKTYQVYVFFADVGAPADTQARAGADSGTGVPNLGSNTTILSGTGILGGYLVGTFTATATTQSFDVTVVKPPYPVWSDGSQSYNLDNPVNAVIVSEKIAAGTMIMIQ